ncbi:DNA mismatch repair protein MutS [Methanoregula sp.]|uniref:DNA mismatch repair protein MutS n=1 Tax=Methanoregula sp. TaxID=2052170 RepID=UPI002C168423|nr:DNA mismatch repair protein MutS [Methanoregula sp.]HVP96007.1 DNA mismatch repair protein MutS [Methanoregula sp.]
MTIAPSPGTGPCADDGKNLTPGMRQYREIKAQYPDAILFFHIGDFFETLEDDAVVVSKELDLVLTSRSKNGDQRIPLAGVPHHAGEGYIARLVAKGYKVAICEQTEDPRTAKGLVKREVVRVITPGTVIDPAMLPSSAAAYLMALSPGAKGADWGMALLDISTGEFFVVAIPAEGVSGSIRSEIARYRPAECIVPSTVDEEMRALMSRDDVVVTPYADDRFLPDRASRTLCDHFGVTSLAGYGCDAMPAAIGAAGAALSYAAETQKSALPHVSALATRSSATGMMLDAITLRNLEVHESIRGGAKGATLFSTLDRTKTPMGSRLLRRQLTRPLTEIARINARLDAVEYFTTSATMRMSLRELLTHHADIERITARIAYGNAGPRDLVALADSLATLPEIRNLLASSTTGSGTGIPDRVTAALDCLIDLPAIIDLIRRAIIDDPPAIAKNGGVIRPGFSLELDGMTGVLHSGKNWIIELQQQEREKTGIKSLKVGYNRIFGYYIDISKSNLSLVPARYERRQTTATGERYTIPELREKEALITDADERVLALERSLYASLIDEIRKEVSAFQRIAQGIAALDVAAALADVAVDFDYVRPLLDKGDAITCRDVRHPVVERSLAGGFVPNDTELSGSKTQIMIITGANMAGKSTYMRSIALCCIMAQAGSFVPARSARIGIIDRIFTRVGAFDDLASGQSTFFVEMLELANILNNMTGKSLVILDEIGRGTSTADGCSIAQAVLEYLHGKSAAGSKTLFATHFHELIGMEGELKRVKNYHFAVQETKKEVVFLRKLIPGATDKSYGIHVARLAGIPKKVTERADAILSDTLSRDTSGGAKARRYTQLLLVDDSLPARAAPPVPDPVIAEIAGLDPDAMTPMQALAKLAELKRRAGTSGRSPKERDA